MTSAHQQIHDLLAAHRWVSGVELGYCLAAGCGWRGSDIAHQEHVAEVLASQLTVPPVDEVATALLQVSHPGYEEWELQHNGTVWRALAQAAIEVIVCARVRDQNVGAR